MVAPATGSAPVSATSANRARARSPKPGGFEPRRHVLSISSNRTTPRGTLSATEHCNGSHRSCPAGLRHSTTRNESWLYSFAYCDDELVGSFAYELTTSGPGPRLAATSHPVGPYTLSE